MIHIFLYKVVRGRQILPADCVQQKAFATWCIDNLSADQNFLRRIIFSEECVFHVSRIANTQNTRVWGNENPGEYREHEIHSEKMTV